MGVISSGFLHDLPEVPDLTVTFLTIAAPLQIAGKIGGDKTWYFRARHWGWTVEVDDQVVASGRVENQSGEPSFGEAMALVVEALWDGALGDAWTLREDEMWAAAGMT